MTEALSAAVSPIGRYYARRRASSRASENRHLVQKGGRRLVEGRRARCERLKGKPKRVHN